MDLTHYISVRVADGTYDIEAARAAHGTYDLESKVSPEMREHLNKIDAGKHR